MTPLLHLVHDLAQSGTAWTAPWHGVGAVGAGCSATAANPVMNMILMRGVELGRARGQFDSVEPGHDDVGEEEVERHFPQAFISLGNRRRTRSRRGPRVLQRLGQEPAHGFIVFGKDNLRHLPARSGGELLLYVALFPCAP